MLWLWRHELSHFFALTFYDFLRSEIDLVLYSSWRQHFLQGLRHWCRTCSSSTLDKHGTQRENTYVLFGMLEDKDGNVVGTDSQEYDTLGIGEQIGGPLADLTGALNNFIKFVAVVSFVTSDI